MFIVHELPHEKTMVIIIMPEKGTDQLQGNNTVFFFALLTISPNTHNFC